MEDIDENSDKSTEREHKKASSTKVKFKGNVAKTKKSKPLVDQLDDTNSIYTPSGIYLGGSTLDRNDSVKVSGKNKMALKKVTGKSTTSDSRYEDQTHSPGHTDNERANFDIICEDVDLEPTTSITKAKS